MKPAAPASISAPMVSSQDWAEITRIGTSGSLSLSLKKPPRPVTSGSRRSRITRSGTRPAASAFSPSCSEFTACTSRVSENLVSVAAIASQ